MSITLTFNQDGAGIPAGSVDRGRTDIKSTGAIGDPRAYPVTITIGNIPATATVDVLLLDEPPESNPLLTELAPETWQLEFDVGCWGPFRVRVTATIADAVVGSVTRRISIRSPGYHIDYPALAERYDPNATAVPTVPSVELTEMNEGSTNRPLVDFHRQLLEAIEGTSGGGGGVIPDGSITEDKLAPELSDNLLRADGTIPFTQDQDAAGHTVGNLGTPTLAGDAVPLWYVQTSFALSGIHMPCRLVATVPVTASNTQVIDGQSTVNGQRILLTSQASPIDNGLYIANDAGAWLRAPDADTSAELMPGMIVFVTDGTAYAESGWILATDAPIAIGTSPLTFARFTGAAQVVAGAGLTKTGDTLDVVAHADGSIVVAADSVQVGVLATDAQHGARAGGTQHAAATTAVAGFLAAADKLKLDGVATGAAALTSSTPAAVGLTPVVGVGTTAARADHVHAHGVQTDGTLHAAATTTVAGFLAAADKLKLDGVAAGAAALASTPPASVAFTAAVGVGTTAARDDHVHPHGAQTDGSLHAAATTSVAGFQSAADKTKLDSVAASAAALTSTAATQITVTTAAAGVATVAARGDHVHSVSIGAPSALAVGGAQSTGSATSLPRSDHQHAMPDVATTSAAGFMAAADKTRLDGMATGAAALTSTAPVAVDNGSAVVGVGTTAARHDHKHSVSIGTPVALAVGGANAQGSATTLTRSDHTHAMPDVATTGAAGFMAAADKTKLDGVETGAQVTSFARVQTALAAASGSVGLNSQRITSVADPSAAQDVATKAYVDAIAQGLDVKASVRLVATTNVAALSGNVSIDGSTTAPGQRVLLVGQTTASANGIYLTAAGAWSRATDADTSAKVTSGMYVFATEGTANSDSGWALITPDPIVLGTTALTFSQVTGAGQITAGAGLTKSGNTLDVVAHADGSIVVAADSVQLGVIATDAQHGARAGGTTHAAVIAAGASGFMTGSDKTKLDGIATAAAAVTSSTPASVGTANALGSGTTAARSDHVHAHGAQTDGTLHAAATTSVAGFLAAADKTRLDALVASYKTAVRVASVGHIPNVDVPGNQPNVVDGISLAIGDRVLVKDQVTVTYANNIYSVTTVGTGSNGTWAKAADADATGELVTGSTVYVAEGTQAGQWWQLTTLGTITIGTTAQTWARKTTPLATAAPASVGTAAAVGVGTTAARADHVHAHGAQTDGTLHAAATTSVAGFLAAADKTKLDGIATSAAALTSTAPANVAAAAVVGVGTTAARFDHVHAHGAQTGDSTLHAAATTSVAGFQSAADKTKLDGIATSAAALTSSAPVANGLAAVGVAATAARADHTHPDSWKEPCRAYYTSSSLTAAGGAPSVTDGVTLSVGDRVLATVSGTPANTGIYVVSIVGTGSNGTWLFVEAVAPGEIVEVFAGSTGYVRTLWTHDGTSLVILIPNASTVRDGLMSYPDKLKLDGISTGATALALASTSPANVAAAAVVGVGTTAARADHVHSHGAQTADSTLHAAATTSVAGFLSAADKTRLDALRARSYFDVRLATATTLPAYTATTISTNRPRLTATSNGALSIDGVAVVAGDLVLVLFEAVANCGVYEVIVAGTAGTPYQLDLAYSGAYTAAVSGSQMIVRTGTAGYAYCNRQFRPGSTSSGLYVEIPGELQVWPRDTTPPTTIYPGWLYELDLLGSSTVSLTLVSPSGSEQVLRGVRFGINHGAPITTLTITPSTPSRIDSPYATGSPSSGVPATSTSYAAIGGSSTTWVCGRGYTSYNPDSPYWKVDTGYGLAAESVILASGRVDITGSAPVAGSIFTGRNSGQASFVPPTVDPSVNGFRLAPNADDSLAADGSFSLLYLAPVTSDRISLYDTTVSDWRTVRVNGFGQAVSGRTAGTPFDVFLQLSAAAPTDGTAAGVTMSFLNWTSASARATAIVQTNGAWTKSGDTTQRYLGTVRPRSATAYQIKRNAADGGATAGPAGIDIWNVSNRKQTAVQVAGPSANYTYSTGAWRQTNGSAQCQVDVVSGLPGDLISLAATALVSSTGTNTFGRCCVAVGKNGTTPGGVRFNTTVYNTLNWVVLRAARDEEVTLGVNAYTWLERASADGAQTWTGYNDANDLTPGIAATLWY